MSDAETIHLSENARRVLEARYLIKDATGRVVETPEAMFRRVAAHVAEAEVAWGGRAAAERWAERFCRRMRRFEFLPNSPTLMNAGTRLGMLSACFVLPVPDSMDGIMDAAKQMALVQQAGGGTGFAFSRLRPRGSIVGGTHGMASGPVSFLRIFDATSGAVRQGGRRRAANMAVLRCDHPDILEFIHCKSDPEALSTFNISVGITDAFMAALDAGGQIELRDPRDGKVVRHESAARIFDAICRAAWSNGDPGVVFLDRINAANPTPRIGSYEGTNPCGEQPLLPHESCNLGSINVSLFVADGRIDFERLAACVHEAVRFLDDVIEVSQFPIPAIDRITRANRKIGLGVMGFADLLVRLGTSYAEPRAVEVAGELMSFIQAEGHAASELLAAERGPFANLAASIYKDAARPPRNSTVTTIAPTGTISLIADCSSGIEPYFALCYWRRALEDQRLLVVSPLFEQRVREAGLYSDELIEQVAAAGGVSDLADLPAELRRLFVTARDVSVEQHIRIQAAFQEHTDNAVSKTVNLPTSATVADVGEAYLLAWRLGCKGITVYRDRSRGEQVLNIGPAPAAEGPAEPRCPKCHSPMQRSGACLLCPGCGFGYCQ